MYGVGNDEVKKGGSGKFGLNKAKLTKFELNLNAGKDNAEGSALDICYTLESGKEMMGRFFPITKAFTKDQKEVTNPKHPDFKKAVEQFNAVVTHMLKAFGVTIEDMKAAFANVASFEQFVSAAAGLLPSNFAEIEIDLFLAYQWAIKGENECTFLEVPKTVKHGKFVCQSIDGEWFECRIKDGVATIGTDAVDVSEQKSSIVFEWEGQTFNVAKDTALCYINKEGLVHPFTRTDWFMSSNFGTRLTLNGDDNAEGGSEETSSEWS